jgi:hypothetical protein
MTDKQILAFVIKYDEKLKQTSLNDRLQDLIQYSQSVL